MSVNGWTNHETWALAVFLEQQKYCYVRDVAIATWAEHRNEPNPSAAALVAMTAKLTRDITANVATIDIYQLGRPLAEALEEIDFEGIADHWLGIMAAYERRPKSAREHR